MVVYARTDHPCPGLDFISPPKCFPIMASATSLLPIDQGPRLILYHQTHHQPNNGPPVSLLPLITNQTGITHIILAAIHINEQPSALTLNDHPPSDPRFHTLWSEVAWLQASGIKVLGMLGGAAKGSFARLDGDDLPRFEAYYCPLRDMIRTHRLDGLDLDIEEATSLHGAIRLIDRLRADFGKDFLITLAPVATALLVGQPHLSGPDFDYHVLEVMRGHEIAWYNVQFYNGWGDASSTFWYEAMMKTGWKAAKIVLGVLTNPSNGGSGYVEVPQLASVLRTLRSRHADFGGVMGWEYFNALPGGIERPWDWAAEVSRVVRSSESSALESAAGLLPLTLPSGASAAQLPAPSHPFPAESVRKLLDLGFSQQQAIAALNSTSGNVEYAAGLLFQD